MEFAAAFPLLEGTPTRLMGRLAPPTIAITSDDSRERWPRAFEEGVQFLDIHSAPSCASD